MAQQESWSRGQQFTRMSHLAQFSGNGDFWDDLDGTAQREYATICRQSPRSRMFELDRWMASGTIQDAVVEYRAEKESEAAEPSNLDLDF